MRSASSLDQYNDDDFFSGGPCPSCRLAINKETGRLKFVRRPNLASDYLKASADQLVVSEKLETTVCDRRWCMGGNDTWRFRVKLMLLIPAVLLPITIIFIALSRSQVIGKAPYHRTYLVQTRRQDERTEETLPRKSIATEHTHTRHTRETDLILTTSGSLAARGDLNSGIKYQMHGS